MQLSQKALEEFKEIYKKKFCKELSDDVANEKGIELLRFIKLIYRPMKKSAGPVVTTKTVTLE